MKKKFVCHVCMNAYTNRNSLVRHIRFVHEKLEKTNSNAFVCTNRNTEFNRRGSLRRHVHCNRCFQHEKSVGTYICNVCKQTYTNRRSFLYHYRCVHETAVKPKVFICNVCKETYTNRGTFLRHYRSVHERAVKAVNVDVFTCSVCTSMYPNRMSFLRHYRSVHERGVNCNEFICSVCKKTYINRRSFLFHYRSTHETGMKFNNFICSACKETYSNRRSFLRHYRSVHETAVQLNNFTCTSCKKTFCRKDMLIRHVQQCHRICNLESNCTYVCAFCYKSFQRKWILRRHIESHLHVNKKVPVPVVGSMKCLFCKDSYSLVNSILDHFVQQHDIQILHKHMKFTSRNEFDEWKKNMEKITVTSFRIRRSKQYKQNTIISFICHRSGSYEVKTSNRIRRVKYQGIKKLGAYCPAAITLRINNSDGSCKVSYVSTHLGHNVYDKEELAHINIPKEERALVASKIARNIPNKRVLIDNISSIHRTETDHKYYMNKLDMSKNLVNCEIKQTSDIASEKDVMNVEAFIIRYEKSILYYKRQNEVDEKYKILQLDDIVIVMMTQFQEEMLIKYSHKVIAVDETFSLDHYEFIMHTFLVIDNLHEGIPVAFVISNRNDEVLIKIALESIKGKVGILCPITFMCNMQLTYINTWNQIMGPVQFYHFCNWHVFESWRENLIKIKNADKKKSMRRRLYELAMCLDKNIFETQLEELLKDPDLEIREFLIYFKKHYSNNTKNWAYCYCKHAFVNTNAHCEAFNRNLKYFNGKLFGKASLTDCLELLNLYLNTQEYFLEKRAIQGKLPNKLKMLRSRHDNLEKELEAKKVYVLVHNNTKDNVEWNVCISEVENDVANIYHVSKCDNYCDTENCKIYCDKCDTCQYAYQCTCPDNMIKHYMCIHIHALCTTLKNQKNALTNFNTVDVHAENIDRSHGYTQLYAHAAEELLAQDEDESRPHINNDILNASDNDELQAYIEIEVLYNSDDELQSDVHDDVLYAHDDDELQAYVDDDVP